jgi:zinc transport system permease protein
MEFIQSLTQHAFLQHALLAGLLASIGCGVMGSYVVVKRIGFLAGGIAHAVLGGMGAAFFFGVDPMYGALIAAITVALLIGWVTLGWRQQEDTLIGAMWAVGMAVGILFISQTPGYQVDLMTYLFGNILLVTTQDLWLMVVLDIVLLLLVILYYRQFLAIAFDEEFARLRGVPVTLFYILLLCLVAVSVVLLIRIVGLILVIALLTLPAAIALQYVQTVGRMMIVATVLGAVFCALGLAVSYQPDLPAGATIILVAGVAYLFSTLLSSLRQRYRTRVITTR